MNAIVFGLTALVALALYIYEIESQFVARARLVTLMSERDMA